jgi:hypothetical protein
VLGITQILAWGSSYYLLAALTAHLLSAEGRKEANLTGLGAPKDGGNPVKI